MLKRVISWSLRNCSALLPVHSSLIESENRYQGDNRFLKQGFKSHLQGVTTDINVIHNGFTIPTESGFIKEPNTVITVAGIDSEGRYYLKGIDKILMLAKHYSDFTFRIVGVSKKIQTHFLKCPQMFSVMISFNLKILFHT